MVPSTHPMAKFDITGAISSRTQFIHAAPVLTSNNPAAPPLVPHTATTVRSTNTSPLTQTVTIIDPLSTFIVQTRPSNESVAAAPATSAAETPPFGPHATVTATTTSPLTPSTSTSIPSRSVTTAPTTSSVTPTPDTKKDTRTLSAGLIAGVVIGSMLVLALCIGIFIRMYSQRRQRRHQEIEAGCIPPLQQTAHTDTDSNPVLTLDPSGEKGHHNRGSTIPAPNPQAPEPEPTSIPESPQLESLPNPLSESHLIPSLAQIQEDVNQDIQVKVIRMEATMGRMAEQIRHLESQLVITGDGNFYTPPPTYISS
ncbi:hypothetical protein BDP27DRAFT_1433657 [Rhodocollybia butyracea]|uniref:Uncharacterized protein n=1 Tax=Rhodocollybia butyracea TaxID=206335 RepID=A0A9P5TY52_9AGAR|nr:hypothetical protein BDP27DRAFT_1433657 [Rhodocollybia butyracea]